jgi:hypothetical protein
MFGAYFLFLLPFIAPYQRKKKGEKVHIFISFKHDEILHSDIIDVQFSSFFLVSF